jgi:hypothetical protein
LKPSSNTGAFYRKSSIAARSFTGQLLLAPSNPKLAKPKSKPRLCKHERQKSQCKDCGTGCCQRLVPRLVPR